MIITPKIPKLTSLRMALSRDLGSSGRKGLYHGNMVDEETQYQFVGLRKSYAYVGAQVRQVIQYPHAPMDGAMNGLSRRVRRLALAALHLAALACVQACTGETPLHKAAEDGDDPAQIRQLIADGADVNAGDSYGSTPLHYAAAFNQEPHIVEALIAAGADVNARDESGATPINYAMANEEVGSGTVIHHYESSPYAPVIKALLAAGADVNTHDDVTGLTPLHGAVLHQELSIVEMLLAAGADVNAYDKLYGMTPLHSAVVWDAEEDIVEALLAAGADVNAVSNEPSEEFLWALKSANLFMEMLMGTVMAFMADDIDEELDLDVTSGWRGGNTPLHIVLHTYGDISIVKMLIEAGADVNARGERGLTPLLIARRNSTSWAIKDALIDAGADVNAEPLDVAEDSEDREAIDLLLDRNKWLYPTMWLAIAAVALLAIFMIWRKLRAPAKGRAKRRA